MIKTIYIDNNEEVTELVQSAFDKYRFLYQIKAGQNKSNFKYETIGLFDNTKLVGTLSYYKEKDILRLFKIAIDPKLQGRGYFSSLIDYAEHIAKEMNIDKLGLYTIKETKSYIIFEKKDFKIINETDADFLEPVHNNKPLTELEMIKTI